MDLRTEPGAVRLPWAVVRVSGPGALEYLQGQLSQDIANLDLDETTWSLLLEPTGKMVAWLRVTRTADDEVLLDAPTASAESIVARLERFKLRTKADIEALDWLGVALRGPGSDQIERDGRGLPIAWPGVAGGTDVIGPRVELGADVLEADPSDLEALRIEAGIPAHGAEITPDTIPAELGRFVIESSVSFTKGCFTGQELVARIDSRGGNVPRPVRGLVIDGDSVPQVGAEVLAEGKSVGRITSSARSATLGPLALAPMKRAVEPGATVEVGWNATKASARVRDLPLL